MSWFKRTSSAREDGRVAVNGRSSPARGGGGGGRDRANTIDPDTCFEVSGALKFSLKKNEDIWTS